MVDLDAFMAHWSAVKGGEVMPRLSDYLDRPAPALQPWTLIVDLADASMPIRLCGTGMARVLGRDYTGFDYLLAVDASRRREVMARDGMCATHPCGLRQMLSAETARGVALDYEIMVLPVRRAEKTFSLIRLSAVNDDLAVGDFPLTVRTYKSSTWFDVGAGRPDAPPWADPSYYCTADEQAVREAY